MKKFVFILSITIFIEANIQAQIHEAIPYSGAPDPRGLAELTLCGQNLQNYGQLSDFLVRNRKSTAADFYKKEDALAVRFAKNNCDLIAVQEILGRNESAAYSALKNLARILRKKNNRIYQVIVGPSNDANLHIGFLVAIDRAEVLNRISYYKVELPKLVEDQKPRLFSRGPLELQINVKQRGNSAPKIVTLINFHFKSQANSARDPSKSGWETYRMEMAEALRRVIEVRHKDVIEKGDALLVLIGDRNSNRDSASARILDGTLRLSQFQGDAICRLSKKGIPLCQVGAANQQLLFSFLTMDPQASLLPGTYIYKKEFSWIDDILAPQMTLRFARAAFDSEGDYDSGVVYEPRNASDHAMTWTRFNW